MTDSGVTFFFDVGDTLLQPREPLHQLYTDQINRMLEVSIDPEQLKPVMMDALEKLSTRVNGHFRYSDGWFEIFIHTILEGLHCPKPWNGIHKSLLQLFDDPKTFIIFSDVVGCLQTVKDLGCRTCVVSNWGFRLAGLLEKLGLLHFFDGCLSSAEVGFEKPDPQIFRLALAETNGLAKKTVHVGDNYECDVAGAKGVGIQGILLDRQGKNREKALTITTLDDLVPLLRSANIV